MGVPSFYRWLSRKFPRTVVDAEEETPVEMDDSDETVPVDTSKPNPNGVEFDNLYLDMNGIIHPACHPEEGPQPKTEEEMIANTFEIVDRLFAIVRPRKVLFMAIDGVAPRAKMNQQRARRFQAAQDKYLKRQEELKLRAEWVAQGRGQELPPERPEKWDHNVITPGTAFMHKLAKGLRYYVHERINNDPGWRNVKVILSDANVPGEGEHKIMEFVRVVRAQPDHDPNTRHVICGLDADLIHLGLASHEAYFSILREVVVMPNSRKCFICGQEGHMAAECTGAPKRKAGEFDEKSDDKPVFNDKPYQFLHIHVLREYLSRTLFVPNLPFEWDFERIVDDFVFLCFFVGNDFLPHLPSLEIREGAIDQLMELYKQLLPRMGRYLTDAGKIDMRLCEMFVIELGTREDGIFRRRMQRQQSQDRTREAAAKRRAAADAAEAQSAVPLRSAGPQLLQRRAVSDPAVSNRAAAAALKREMMEGTAGAAAAAAAPAAAPAAAAPTADPTAAPTAALTADPAAADPTATPAAASAASGGDADGGASAGVNDMATGDATGDGNGNGNGNGDAPRAPSPPNEDGQPSVKRLRTDPDVGQPVDGSADASAAAASFLDSLDTVLRKHESVDKVENVVRLGEEGWRERYYQKKFGTSADDRELVDRVAQAYAEGLAWVLAYYYNGLASWKWFYPFHYAPFAADLARIGSYGDITFDRAEPFRPFDQLMGVMPERSGHCLPDSYRKLMAAGSPIHDFYPETFPVDMEGKKWAWQGVCLLPFIDEARLMTAIKPLEVTLTAEERERNRIGEVFVYVSVGSDPLAMTLSGLRDLSAGLSPAEIRARAAETTERNEGLSGTVCLATRPLPPVAAVAADGNGNGNGAAAVVDDQGKTLPAPGGEVAPPPSLAAYDAKRFAVIAASEAECAVYTLPPHVAHTVHSLPGTVPPPPVLTHHDLAQLENSERRRGRTVFVNVPGFKAADGPGPGPNPFSLGRGAQPLIRGAMGYARRGGGPPPQWGRRPAPPPRGMYRGEPAPPPRYGYPPQQQQQQQQQPRPGAAWGAGLSAAAAAAAALPPATAARGCVCAAPAAVPAATVPPRPAAAAAAAAALPAAAAAPVGLSPLLEH